MVDKQQAKAHCRNNTWTTIILRSDLQTKDKPSWSYYCTHFMMNPPHMFGEPFLWTSEPYCKTQAPCIQNDCKIPIPSCRFVPNTSKLCFCTQVLFQGHPFFLSSDLWLEKKAIPKCKKNNEVSFSFYTHCPSSLNHPLNKTSYFHWGLPIHWTFHAFSETLELGQTSNCWVEPDAPGSSCGHFLSRETNGKTETTKLPNWENPVDICKGVYAVIYIHCNVSLLTVICIYCFVFFVFCIQVNPIKNHPQ